MTLSAARNIGRRMAEWLMNVELESSDRRQSQCRFWCLPGVSEETKDIVFLTFSAILLMSVPFTIYSASNRTSAPNTEIINKWINKRIVRFQAITAVLTKLQVLWDMSSCRLVDNYRCFGGTQCFRLQVSTKSWTALGVDTANIPQYLNPNTVIEFENSGFFTELSVRATDLLNVTSCRLVDGVPNCKASHPEYQRLFR